MEMFTGIKPIQFACEEVALKMFKRPQITPIVGRNTVENRLRSKPSFIHKIQSIYEKYDLEYTSKIRRFTSGKHQRRNNKS